MFNRHLYGTRSWHPLRKGKNPTVKINVRDPSVSGFVLPLTWWFALDMTNMMFAEEIEGTLPAMFVHSQSCLSNGNHTQPRHFVFCAVDQTGSWWIRRWGGRREVSWDFSSGGTMIGHWQMTPGSSWFCIPPHDPLSGWWFQTLFIFHNIWDVILPID